MSRPNPGPWHLVVPVKGGTGAKSRLEPPEGVSRAALAEAMAQDTLTAAAGGMPGGRVFVVAGDERVAEWADRLGATVVPDPGQGLDGAVRAGLVAALDAADSAVAVLLGDVPALRSADLAAALGAAAAYDRAFVPDAVGTGTVLLTARRPALMRPRFGPRSAARHESAGHHRLDVALPSLRTDVDDADDLAVAAVLGLGPRSAALLGRASRRTDRSVVGLDAGHRGDVARARLSGMQASVHTFDEATGAGTALLDDGHQVRFAGAVFQASALRKLRSGQRITIDLAEDGRTVRRLWVVGVGEGQPIR